MKKLFTFIAIACFIVSPVFSQEVVVEWNFPEDSADSIADGGSDLNLDKLIRTVGGTSQINYKNGATTKAAQATNWQNGSESKYWMVEFNSQVYSDLILSSKLSSGGNDPGPRDFRVDFRIGENGEWTPVPNSIITTANDWETGVIENLSLPEDCNNQASVFLRWIMTSDTAASGMLVEPSGKLKIDDIVIMGNDISAVDEQSGFCVSVYPNPCINYLKINTNVEKVSLLILDMSGKDILLEYLENKSIVNVTGLDPGMYIIWVVDKNNNVISSQKILKKQNDQPF